jgi:hypothetical protein
LKHIILQILYDHLNRVTVFGAVHGARKPIAFEIGRAMPGLDGYGAGFGPELT